jgi:uncharacterized coiled-coil protein SlyX
MCYNVHILNNELQGVIKMPKKTKETYKEPSMAEWLKSREEAFRKRDAELLELKERIREGLKSEMSDPKQKRITKTELEAKITRLETTISEQEQYINSLESLINDLRLNESVVQKLNDEYNQRRVPIKNERGAGRKPKLTKELIHEVKCLRGDGLTQRAIADKLSISVGLVNKACNTLGLNGKKLSPIPFTNPD